MVRLSEVSYIGDQSSDRQAAHHDTGCCVARPMPNRVRVFWYISGPVTIMNGFLQPLCDSPRFRSPKSGLVAFFILHDFFFLSKIMFSKVIVSPLLLAALANCLVFKRE